MSIGVEWDGVTIFIQSTPERQTNLSAFIVDITVFKSVITKLSSNIFNLISPLELRSPTYIAHIRI
jgi:hypothetical protein